MKITRLEAWRIAVPFAKPYKLSKVYGTIHDALAVILKLYTDQGVVGLGEADPMPPFTEETPAGVVAALRDYLGPRLLGQDPRAVPVLEAMMDQVLYGNHTAKGAVSMALYDILGQVEGVPVHTLLGGRVRARIPLLRGTGSGTAEEDLAVIEMRMAEGFRTFMLKMGARPIEDEITRVRQVRDHLDEEVRLLVDANQGWQVREAMRFMAGLEDLKLELMEQPIPRWDLSGLKRIRARAPWPVSADESLVTPRDALRLIQEEAVDVFSIKVSKNGGLSAAKKIALVAEAAGLKCLMNSMLEFGVTQAASLHLGATLTNLVDFGHAYGSPLRLSDDVTNYSDLVSQAVVEVPDEPGLGVRLEEAKLKKYAAEHVEIDQSR